jgi:hypothetical protein
MNDLNSCSKVALGVLVITLIILYYQTYIMPKEAYTNFTSFDSNLPNRNGFGNYYRVGFNRSENLGWMPHENWDYLRPEFSECPDCFHYDKIY